MNLLKIIKISLQNLYVNKLRSTLTLLGIIIGVSSIIITVALGDGNKTQVSNEIEKIGMDMVLVTPDNTAWKYGGFISLKEEDILDLPKETSAVKLAAPAVLYNRTMEYRGRQAWTLITASTPYIASIQRLNIIRGRFFSDLDMRNRRDVCVIERTENMKTLFGIDDPLNKDVSLLSHRFKVIGIAEKKLDALQALGLWEKIPSKIFIPLPTFRKVNKQKFFVLGYMQAQSPQMTDTAISQIKAALSRKYGKIENKIKINRVTTLLEAREKIAALLTLIGGIIAAVALIVGGIGIMNIMLVSVTERTREIGIFKALGARKRDVLLIFLAESSLLCAVGGIAGIIFGILVVLIVAPIIKIPTVISFWPIMIGFVFSAAIGIVSGVYPANRAANLDPAAALRYE